MPTIKEMIQLMINEDKNGKPFPFALTLTTYNRSLQNGGKIEVFPICYVKSKKPLNARTGTVHIMLPNGETRTPHVSLITHFNGERVS